MIEISIGMKSLHKYIYRFRVQENEPRIKLLGDRLSTCMLDF